MEPSKEKVSTMGMFDYVSAPTIFCTDKSCIGEFKDWQSKSGGCNLDLIHPSSVDKFSTRCTHCKMWGEFILEDPSVGRYRLHTRPTLLSDTVTRTQATMVAGPRTDLKEALERVIEELRKAHAVIDEIGEVLRQVPDMELVSPLSAAKILVNRLTHAK